MYYITEKRKNRNMPSARTRAFELITSEFYENIYHECLKSMDDEDEIPDHVNEILLKCFTSMKVYDNSKSMLSTWVMAIARNYILDYKKLSLCRPEFITCDTDFFDMHTRDDDFFASSNKTIICENYKAEYIRELLKLMKNRHKLILRFRTDGLSYKEISGIMRISEKAAMELHRRAVKRLKQLYWEFIEEFG